MCESDNDNLKLDDKQRQLVSDNHSLIYSYAKSKNLYLDEYYDLLAIALCKAAKSFDEGKTKFSTFAYKCMENEVNTYWRKLNAQYSIPQDMIVYYHASQSIDETECRDFSDLFYDYESQESAEYAIMFSEFINGLEDKEKSIAIMLASGMKHKEIGERLLCSRQSVDYHIKIIKNKLLNYLNK